MESDSTLPERAKRQTVIAVPVLGPEKPGPVPEQTPEPVAVETGTEQESGNGTWHESDLEELRKEIPDVQTQGDDGMMADAPIIVEEPEAVAEAEAETAADAMPGEPAEPSGDEPSGDEPSENDAGDGQAKRKPTPIADRVRLGICTTCGLEPARENRKTCEKCAAKARADWHRRQQEKKEAREKQEAAEAEAAEAAKAERRESQESIQESTEEQIMEGETTSMGQDDKEQDERFREWLEIEIDGAEEDVAAARETLFAANARLEELRTAERLFMEFVHWDETGPPLMELEIDLDGASNMVERARLIFQVARRRLSSMEIAEYICGKGYSRSLPENLQKTIQRELIEDTDFTRIDASLFEYTPVLEEADANGVIAA